MKQKTARSDEAIKGLIGEEIEAFDKDTKEMQEEMEAVEATLEKMQRQGAKLTTLLRSVENKK